MKAATWLKENGYPYSDSIALTSSNEEFIAGGEFGVEIPVINSLKALELTVEQLRASGTYCTRFNETHGSHLLSDSEITEMLHLCKGEGYGMLFGLGPRPEYDVKASFYRTKFGLEMGRQMNNNDGIRYCVDEAYRLVELGCRGIIVYDLGVLKLLNEMRNKGELPKNTIFKTSSHCMVSNPLIAKIFQENGADSVTTTHDVGLPVYMEMRKLCPQMALDIPTDVYKTKGGFIRFFELSEMIRVGSPVFLKMGASAQSDPYDEVGNKTIVNRVERVKRGLDILESSGANYSQIGSGDAQICLPDL